MVENSEDDVVDPLKNLEKLFLQLVGFLLVNLKIIAVVIGLIFLISILLLLGFFNWLGL